MFGAEFYPTPRNIIEKMLEPYKASIKHRGINGYYFDGYSLGDKIILDPEAGKADILDYVTGAYVLSHDDKYDRDETTKQSIEKKNVYCCENDPNLKHILQEKGYKVIADDFLCNRKITM